MADNTYIQEMVKILEKLSKIKQGETIILDNTELQIDPKKLTDNLLYLKVVYEVITYDKPFNQERYISEVGSYIETNNICVECKLINREKLLEMLPGLQKENRKIQREVNREKKKKEEEVKIIKIITCVRLNKSQHKYLIIFNKNYNDYLEVDKIKDAWDLLFRVAERERITINKKYKNNIDFLNLNPKCKLYTKTGHNPTKILKVDGTIIIPNIPIDLISEQAYKLRRKA